MEVYNVLFESMPLLTATTHTVANFQRCTLYMHNVYNVQYNVQNASSDTYIERFSISRKCVNSVYYNISTRKFSYMWKLLYMPLHPIRTIYCKIYLTNNRLTTHTQKSKFSFKATRFSTAYKSTLSKIYNFI